MSLYNSTKFIPFSLTEPKVKNVKAENQNGYVSDKSLKQPSQKLSNGEDKREKTETEMPIVPFSSKVSPINTWKLSERHKGCLSSQEKALTEIKKSRNESARYIQNVYNLEILTNNAIAIQQFGITAIQNDPENVELKVDIFEYDNARSMLLRILDLILTQGYMEVPEELQGNLRVLYNGLSNDWSDYSHTFKMRSGDEIEAGKAYTTVETLRTLNAEYSDSSYQNELYARFLRSFLKVYQVIAAKKIAFIVYEKHRAAAEQRAQAHSQSTSASVTASGSVGGAKLSGSMGFSKSIGGADAVYLSSSNSANVSVGISLGLGKLASFSFSVGSNVTMGSVFTNVLQMIDSGQAPKNWLLGSVSEIIVAIGEYR